MIHINIHLRFNSLEIFMYTHKALDTTDVYKHKIKKQTSSSQDRLP